MVDALWGKQIISEFNLHDTFGYNFSMIYVSVQIQKDFYSTYFIF